MKTIKELSILASISIIVAFAFNYFSPAGIALVGQWDIANGVITANEKNDIDLDNLEIGDIALAKELYDSKKFLFVDARSWENYDEGHIKGAISLPVGQFDGDARLYTVRGGQAGLSDDGSGLARAAQNAQAGLSAQPLRRTAPPRHFPPPLIDLQDLQPDRLI